MYMPSCENGISAAFFRKYFSKHTDGTKVLVDDCLFLGAIVTWLADKTFLEKQEPMPSSFPIPRGSSTMLREQLSKFEKEVSMMSKVRNITD